MLLKVVTSASDDCNVLSTFCKTEKRRGIMYGRAFKVVLSNVQQNYSPAILYVSWATKAKKTHVAYVLNILSVIGERILLVRLYKLSETIRNGNRGLRFGYGVRPYFIPLPVNKDKGDFRVYFYLLQNV